MSNELMENKEAVVHVLTAGRKYRPVTPTPYKIKPIDLSDKWKPLNRPAVDMRPVITQIGLTVRGQTNGAPCAVHAFTFLLEYQYIRRIFSNLSEQYLQYVTFNVEHPHMTGGENFWALNAGYQKWGVVPQNDVPNADQVPQSISQDTMNKGKAGLRLNQEMIKNWDSSTGVTDQQLSKVLYHLDNDTPVGAGVLWPIHFETHMVSGVDLMKVPVANDKWSVVVDGHAIALVGYRSNPIFPQNGYFIFRNSWTEHWGDKGYGYMPFEYIKRYCNDLMVFKLP